MVMQSDLDSTGGISKTGTDFTNHLNANGPGVHKLRWDSDSMRVTLKKQFLDQLSFVSCHHRVRDLLRLGIFFYKMR